GNLPPFKIECVAVAVASRKTESTADMAVLLEPAQVLVVGNIAPDEITPNAAPRWPFGPQRASVEPHDRRVAELRLEALVENHDVRIWVSNRRRIRAKVSSERVLRHGGQRCQASRCAEETATAQFEVALFARADRFGKIDELVKLDTRHGPVSSETVDCFLRSGC